MSIKDFLKRILPLPAKGQREEFAYIKTKLQENKKQSTLQLEQQGKAINENKRKLEILANAINELQKTVENTRLKEKQCEESLKKDIARVEGCLKRVDANIIPRVLWSNSFEREVIRLNWGDVTEKDDFAEKFMKLTRGMDAKSVETIIRILLRVKAYLNTDKNVLDLYTREEQEEIRLLKENFHDEILKLSDDIFAYRNYFLPVKHFEESVFYYKHGLAEVNTAARVKGNTIIDAGGFIGDSVLVLEELQPDKIYTFEALPDNFKQLQKTLELNDLKNVIAENVALGSEPGKCTLHVAGSGTNAIGSGGLNYTGEVEVPVITLDDYVAEHKIDNIALIKVDVEGAEPDFLAGAKHTICAQRPILLLSLYHNAHDLFELKPLVESWDLGYKFKIHKPTFGSVTGEILLIAEIPPNLLGNT